MCIVSVRYSDLYKDEYLLNSVDLQKDINIEVISKSIQSELNKSFCLNDIIIFEDMIEGRVIDKSDRKFMAYYNRRKDLVNNIVMISRFRYAVESLLPDGISYKAANKYVFSILLDFLGLNSLLMANMGIILDNNKLRNCYTFYFEDAKDDEGFDKKSFDRLKVKLTKEFLRIYT